MELIKRVNKLYDENCKKPKLFRPDKFSAALKLPYFNKTTQLSENKVQELIQLNYNQINPRVVFVSNPVLRLGD